MPLSLEGGVLDRVEGQFAGSITVYSRLLCLAFEVAVNLARPDITGRLR